MSLEMWNGLNNSFQLTSSIQQKQVMGWLSAVLGIAAFLVAPPGQAQTLYHISLNTAPLIQQSAQPFSLDFQITDGSGLYPADDNNTAILSNFVFGPGGNASGVPLLTGGAQGELSSTVVLQDSDFLNDFNQTFVPGTSLSFDLTLTQNADSTPGSAPDQFSFAILDSSGTELPTQGLYTVGSDVFLTTDITGQSSIIQTFGSDSTRSPQAGGSPILLDAPVVQEAAPVPESSTLILFAAGLAVLGMLARKCRQNLEAKARSN